MKRKLAVAGGLIAFCLAVVVTRAFWDGASALAQGDAALERGDREEAITRWRRAARWYVPGAPHVRRAYQRLEGAARAAEAAGDRQGALDAWRAVYSSIMATRSVYTPYPALCARARASIARLMAEEPSPKDAGDTREAREAWHLSLLSRDEAPSVFWSIVALVAFAGWVGGGFWFAWRGISPDDKLVKREAARAGVLILIGLVVWMLALYQA